MYIVFPKCLEIHVQLLVSKAGSLSGGDTFKYSEWFLLYINNIKLLLKYKLYLKLYKYMLILMINTIIC